MEEWEFKEEFSKPIDGEIIYVSQDDWEWLAEYLKEKDNDKAESSLREMPEADSERAV